MTKPDFIKNVKDDKGNEHTVSIFGKMVKHGNREFVSMKAFKLFINKTETVTTTIKENEFTEEWIVELFVEGVYQGVATDYYTDDFEDAKQTAKAMIEHKKQFLAMREETKKIEEFKELTKRDLARVIVQALFQSDRLPKEDNMYVRKQMKCKRETLVVNYKLAHKILTDLGKVIK